MAVVDQTNRIGELAIGPVTRSLTELLIRQVDERGVVVWYDPERSYADVAAGLALPDTTFARYSDSFFQLRRNVDAQFDGADRPRLLVYVPLDPARTGDALAEIEAAGVSVYPGATPVTRNTRLAVLGRRVLAPILGDDAANAIQKQIEAGTLALADLERLAEQGAGVASGVIALIFGTANPADVALAFVSSPERDAELQRRDAFPALVSLLQTYFDALPSVVPGGDQAEAGQVRRWFARHVMLSDLAAGLGDHLPSALTSYPVAQRSAAREACQTLVQTWRMRLDLRDSYVAAATQLDQSLAVADWGVEAFITNRPDTLLSIETQLQRSVVNGLLERPDDALLDLARQRQGRFWASAKPEVQAQWALIATAGALLRQADRVAHTLKTGANDASALLAGYTGDSEPWCLLDTYHRWLERRIAELDDDPADRPGELSKLLFRARQRYTEVGSQLAEAFVRAGAAAHFQVEGFPRQDATFEARVRPALGHGKVAYILVDALRFEMARELFLSLGDSFEGKLTPAVGVVPSITPVGMAALLPGAAGKLTLTAGGNGRLAVSIDDRVLKDRQARLTYLVERLGERVYATKLDDVITAKKATRQGIEAADLVLVTSQEIDALCEGDNVALARRAMDDVLRDLRRALHQLARLGVETFVITADHGFIFGEEIESDFKIDPPGGKTVELHRRVWLGKGGTAGPSFLRTTAADFGLQGDLEIAVPYTLAGFKVAGGSAAYFHGGLSLPECVIPVAVLTKVASAALPSGSTMTWELRPGSKKVTTRFFSIQIGGRQEGLFGTSAPRVRLEARDRRGSVARAVSASYGFDEATGDVELRWKPDQDRVIDPNTVTMALIADELPSTVQAVLIDVATGAEVARTDQIPVSVTL